MTAPTRDIARIDAIREFNRFYTQRIGVLRRNPYGSDLPLTEARVLYELRHRDGLVASELSRELDIDPGYMSRILGRFEQKGWLRRKPAEKDGRRVTLALSAAGRRMVARIERASQEQVGQLLDPLPESARTTLLRGIRTIRHLLDHGQTAPEVTLRMHRAGDIGWIVQRHGELYADEYDWDETFEALVADIAARFIRRLDPQRERCWIAEQDGVRVGCVMVVRRSRFVAQLRLLLVEPSARGLGIGKRLVDECIAFARARGYRRMVLWTNGGLDAARGIYESRGFRLVREEPHHSFGHDLIGQTFELAL